MRNILNEEMFFLSMGEYDVFGAAHHTENSKAVIISAHGLNGERVDAHRILVKFSRQCAQNGIASYRFDFSGCGVNENDFHKSNIHSRVEELVCVVRYVREAYPDVPVFLHGFSDGCRVVYQSFEQIRPDGCLFWSPILFPSKADDTDVSDIPWQKLEGERCPVKPFLGLWLGFDYIREYGHMKDTCFGKTPCVIFKGSLDSSVDESIELLQNKAEVLDLKICSGCGHIYETKECTVQVIKNSIQWMKECTERV